MHRMVVALVLAIVAPAPSADAATWARPVSGGVTRPFSMRGSPFVAGQHRGVDLAAAPGTMVGAPCAGRVVVAARIGSSRGVVTIACDGWRASVLPLARIAVRQGATIEAGDPVGAADATPAHAGLHVGVRRASERFGYVDPLRFLPEGHAPPLGRAPPPTAVSRRKPPPPPAARVVAAGTSAAAPGPRLIPWPAWAGIGMLVIGAASGLTLRRRQARTLRRRAATAAGQRTAHAG